MSKEIENWRNIEGYEGKYMISSLGRVKSLARTTINNGKTHKLKERLLKQNLNNAGYLIVGLYDKGEKRTFGIHVLVAKSFLENPNNKPEVNHINEIKTDNNVNNLQWCTRAENLNHGSCIERMSKSLVGQNKKKLWKSVKQYSLDGQLIKKWDSVSQIEKSLGFLPPNIVACCKGRHKQAYGYSWKY